MNTRKRSQSNRRCEPGKSRGQRKSQWVKSGTWPDQQRARTKRLQGTKLKAPLPVSSSCSIMGTWLGSRKRSPVFQEQRFGPAGRSQQPPLSTAFLGQAAWPDPKGAVTNTAINSDSGTGHPEGWGHPRDHVTAPGHDLPLGRNQRLQPRVASCPLAAAPPPHFCAPILGLTAV